ncbi:hypothetical protein [Archangium lipolyticum]|uniref:hypothetical protein n=1 Tax=Archangium lipolyticum TaxID=2970465 RepID=UPI00214A510B|nr:hypothetical protein [Archangium lipolyticum]
MKRLMGGMGLACLLGTAAVAGGPVLREQVRVKVDGVVERWRLEWRSTPALECFESSGAVSCGCEGFAYAERGDLELVRLRPGKPPERVPLTPLFENLAMKVDEPKAMLRRWAPREGDDEIHPDKLMGVLGRRKSLRAMELGDYDHDGQAREFVLQTNAFICGLREAVLIGYDRRDGRVRALGTAEHPEKPLVLEPETWAELLKSKQVERVEMECGDHGSEIRDVMRVSADDKGLHATLDRYPCTDDEDGVGERESSKAL